MQFLGYDQIIRWLPLPGMSWAKGGSCFAACWLVALVSGCGGQAEFESNGTFRLRLEAETEADQQPGAEAVRELLGQWFGTPDQPRWPEMAESDSENKTPLVDPQRLISAAGRQYSDRDDNHFGLYREHCNQCHGLTGHGRGPSAMFLSPYPRDFRPGWFKYKSTKRSAKPTREDLLTLIKHGVPGTSMPSFAVVEEDDLQALVDYVIYLSVRGEVERELFYEVAHDPELLEGVHGRISDDSSESVVRVIEVKSTLEAKASEIFRAVTDQWRDASESFVQVTVPDWFDDKAKMAEAVERGRLIFQGSVAACASCHGKTGAGNGLVRDYDEWTKDGTVRAGIEPTDKIALKKYLAAGGLKPVPISPRDLRSGIYRGGGSPEVLYRRIVQGIDGTPMPAVAMKPENPQGLSGEEVWDLVAYVSAMPAEAEVNTAANKVADLKVPAAVGGVTSAVEGRP